MNKFLPYLRIARIDHWFKNIFMLPGIALAILLSAQTWVSHLIGSLTALISLCLLSSANYTINEWLDARSDQFHPVKKFRPSAMGQVKARYVWLQYFALVAAGLSLAATLPKAFIITACIFILMGCIYNVPPVRTKDRAYLDVLSEAINNPIRLLMGWTAIISDSLPPSSILLAYWMGGAFLMGVKRFAEYRFIGDSSTAALYRRSFAVYDADKLLLSSFFYALCASFFLAIFLIKYRIEFLISFPLFAALFTWYLAMGLRENSPTQNPEDLLAEKSFIGFVCLLCLIVGILFVVDIPILGMLVSRLQY